MRRTHLRGHDNILKRLFVHGAGFNLGLVMRALIGVGTPRGLQGLLHACVTLLVTLWTARTASVDDFAPPAGWWSPCPRFDPSCAAIAQLGV
jgi:hypothetical protein